MRFWKKTRPSLSAALVTLPTSRVCDGSVPPTVIWLISVAEFRAAGLPLASFCLTTVRSPGPISWRVHVLPARSVPETILASSGGLPGLPPRAEGPVPWGGLPRRHKTRLPKREEADRPTGPARRCRAGADPLREPGTSSRPDRAAGEDARPFARPPVTWQFVGPFSIIGSPGRALERIRKIVPDRHNRHPLPPWSSAEPHEDQISELGVRPSRGAARGSTPPRRGFTSHETLIEQPPPPRRPHHAGTRRAASSSGHAAGPGPTHPRRGPGRPPDRPAHVLSRAGTVEALRGENPAEEQGLYPPDDGRSG